MISRHRSFALDRKFNRAIEHGWQSPSAWPGALNYSRNSILPIRDDAVTRARQPRLIDSLWEGSIRLSHRYRRRVEDDLIRRMRGTIGFRDKFRHAVSTVADTVAETSSG